jgi:sugar lactone lactonase YvrE
LAVDAAGNLFVLDAGNQRVRRVDRQGVITTVAGDGRVSFGGDGGPATRASLYEAKGVAVDQAGNLYIADTFHHRIRKVDRAGIITTVAGNGVGGFSGDGGPATQASLNFPYDIAPDSSGNLYIADLGNYRIRKVRANGIISTVAGNGQSGFSGDFGPATEATLYSAGGVAADENGNLYMADLGNYRIRKVSANGIISTVAGNGVRGFSGDGSAATQASLGGPIHVTLDAAGNLYIADTPNQRIRRVQLVPGQ